VSETYRTEEEQVEALKRWWQENGRSMLVGVVLAVGLGLGWQAWQKNQEVAAANASLLYQQMLTALAAESPTSEARARELAGELKDAHRGSVYAQFAALHLARLAVNAGNPAAAETELRWALAKADGELEEVAQLRLARVLADRGQTDAALELLAQGQGGQLAAAYAMARGDVLFAAGREDEALLAYEAAVSSMGVDAPLPPSLREKLEFLRSAAPVVAGEEPL
jgi:predicted negative regulator of RcsB-dependent stress response